jgi:hypothetical protein
MKTGRLAPFMQIGEPGLDPVLLEQPFAEEGIPRDESFGVFLGLAVEDDQAPDLSANGPPR